MVKKLLVLTLVLFHSATYAASAILVEYPVIDLPEKTFYTDQINKLTIQVIAKYKGYEIYFSNNATLEKNKSLNKLAVRIESLTEDNYSVLASQVSGRTGKDLKKAWAINIPKRFVLLQARLSIVEALYGKDIAKEEKSLLKKKDALFKEFLEKQEAAEKAGGSGAGETKDKNKKTSIEETLKERRAQEISLEEQDFSLYKSSLDANLEYKEAVSLRADQKQSEATRGFDVERNSKGKQFDDPEALKREIRMTLTQTQKSEQKDTAQEKKSKKVENSENSSKSGLILTKKVSDEVNPHGKSTRPRENRTLFDAVYLNRVLGTQYLIDTTNNFNFAGGRITHRRNLSKTTGDDLVFSFMNLKMLGLNETQFTVPDIRNFHFQYLSAFNTLPFDMLFGLHYENMFFITLPELNKGLKVVENHIGWAQVGIERVFRWTKNTYFVLQGLYAQNVYSKSNFMSGTDVKLDATRFNYGGEMIWKKLRVGIQYSREDFTSNTFSDLKISQSSYFLNVAYAL